MRVVLDTNAIIGAGTAWLMTTPTTPSSLAQRLLMHVVDNHTGILCREIAGEYYLKLRDRGHTDERIVRLLGWLLGAFERIKLTTYSCNPQPTDFDDTIFLLCAIEGGAHFLITDDGHLLALATAYNPPQIMNRDAAAVSLGVP